jgi:phage-related holin
MFQTKTAIINMETFFPKVLALFLAYFASVAEMIHVMLIFLALDTISGIWAALKAGDKIRSQKLRRTVYKFLWYTVAVMSAWMMEKTFTLSWSHLASIVAGFISLVELKSIFENISRITGEPVFLRIIKMFKRKTGETLDEILPDEKFDNDPKPKNTSHE